MDQPDIAAGARVIVTAGYPPLAFIYGLFTPTITINGQQYRLPWGKHSFGLVPGSYEVSVSYPWLFMPECGKNTVRFSLQVGEVRTVTYMASYIRYLPGSISVT